MSTKKIKDGMSKQLVSTSSSKTKATREQSTDRKTKKKEEKIVSRTRTTSKIQSKKAIDDEDKLKKTPLKPQNQSSTRKASRPPPQIKKISNTPKISTRSKTDRPVTPPSSRVTKTQYFPSKKMYSNALKTEDIVKIKTQNKIDTSTLKKSTEPRKSVIKKGYEASPDTSSISERPKTATLRKGSIVNNNIVGPDVPKHKVPKAAIKKPLDETPDEYEDDFDSYESDFEEYNSSDSATNIPSDTTTSDSSETESLEQQSAPKRVSSAGTDDEKKLDSGNYELPDSRHRQILDNIKESIEKENAHLNQEQNNRSNLGSLSDEGFEDGKSLQFINFLGAQKKYQHRKSMEIKRKRGEEILSMIRLDHYSFTLLDLAPVPYDVFIKNYGKSNSVQASVQTGEDDLDEEVQTEEIISVSKWTQFPPNFKKIDQKQDEEFWEIYKCNYLGVGGDKINKPKPVNPNENSLEKFLLSAGNLILNIQAEENFQIDEDSQNKSTIPFSKGYILYNTQNQRELKKRPISEVSFCLNNSNKILTVHGPGEDDSEQSIICLWNLSNVEEPEMMLVSFGEVSCCSFSRECPSLILGGLKNGMVVIWDTKESLACHLNVMKEQKDTIMRTPTYSTEINHGHCCKIVSIQTLLNTVTDSDLFTDQKSAEVCSLDEDGEVIIWSVIFKETNQGKVVENQGLAHWGAVIITINTRISLSKLYPEIDDFKCTDLALSQFDSSHLYISTNYGIIIHCLASGGKTSVKKFLPDATTQANCLEMCPFAPQFILAGFDNGNISFYSRIVERPLMVLSNKDIADGKCKIQMIQWSYNHPLIFYAKDETNTIHVWNLKVSDMFPIFSVPFKDKIVRMKLSPVIKSNDEIPEKTYMMIATDKGSVYVHLLDDEHGQQSLEEFESEKRRFLNYINRYV